MAFWEGVSSARTTGTSESGPRGDVNSSRIYFAQSSSAVGQGATHGDTTSLPRSIDDATVASVSSTNASRIRRRNRQITSCLECRRRKLKCDKQAPCNNCARFRRDCLYLAPALDPHSQQKLSEIKDKMGALERNLEQDILSRAQKPHASGTTLTNLQPEVSVKSEVDEEDNDEEGDGIGGDEDALEPTPLATLDNVYDDNDMDDQELMDLGVQMGKMRISERIGGYIRPKLVDELSDTLADVQAARDNDLMLTGKDDHASSQSSQGKMQISTRSYVGPGPEYIAPSSSFFFPGTNMSTNLLDYLPGKIVADQLIEQYWRAVHYMCKTVHRPTFEAQYSLFWDQIRSNREPVAPVQAIILAAMFSAAVSLTHEETMNRFNTSKTALVDSLRSGTEFALGKANFLRTTRIDTMQALVMYLIPLVRAEVSRAHSALVGTAIRLAECMGLHRDGSLYNMAPVEIQVRRLIYHQLSFLDMRTCESTGPRPQIRKEDCDTKFPFNADDEDLLDPNFKDTDEKSGWTDNTFMRMRAEAADVRRQVWFDIRAIDQKKKSLSSVLVKMQKRLAAMQAKFVPMINERIPLQRLAKLVLTMHVGGVHLQVLHRYLFSTSQRMPDRLRQVLIEAGVSQMECGIEMETIPSLSDWRWYRGAFNQFHSALLLLVEVYAYPMRKEAARIWKCLDYIFEIPPHLVPKQKAELVLTDLRDRMAYYHQIRRVKVSNQMAQRTQGSSKSFYRGGNYIVDEFGQMHQIASMADAVPSNFSPPMQPESSPSNTASRQGSVPVNPAGPAQQSNMSTMEDIDWAEWEKVFNPEVYTGDLNIPDYNMTDFTGDFAAASMDPTMYNVQATQNIHDIGITQSNAFNVPISGDLSDVTFAPTSFVPAPRRYQYPGV